MSADDKDLTILNHDQQLAADLKAGKVSADEVERIWDLTSDLSAQAPINVRRAMIAIRAAETPDQKVHLAMQFMLSAATEIQAAMTRDESKFAHLVAGTEAIVRALQNVNPLAHRLERIEALVDGLGEMVERKFAELAKASLTPQEWRRIAEAPGEEMFEDGATEAIPKDRWTCLCGASFENEDDYDRHAMGCVSEPEEAIPDADAEPNAARAESIGSAWAQPPDQGPLYLYECPNEKCAYTYLSGIRTNPVEVEQFRCLAHNLVLNYAGVAQPEDRANFARQILKHT